MATREFDADFIFDIAKRAREGVNARAHEAWVDTYKGDRYQWHVDENKRRNNRWLTKLGVWEVETILPFDEWIEERKTWTDPDGWGFGTWRMHLSRYDDDRAELRRIMNLAEEEAKASKVVRISDDEYNTLRFYEKAAP
ncbi:hypothetical protein [Xanthomonas phage X1]|nr:hypothetical protein [Xanthomonas phage X1]